MVSINKKMDKHTSHPYYGIRLRDKEQSTAHSNIDESKNNLLSERSQTRKNTYL